MSIKIKGLDKLTKDLRKFGEEGNKVVKREIDIAGTNIQRGAFQRAPSYLDSNQTAPLNIKQRIDKTFENGGLTVKVGVQSQNELDAYVEFGTGLDAKQILNQPQYTDEIRALALTFFKTGDGTLKGTPYLFPSFFEESPRLIENLKNELNNLADKV
jgi:HK97 gp10 family phage protein